LVAHGGGVYCSGSFRACLGFRHLDCLFLLLLQNFGGVWTMTDISIAFGATCNPLCQQLGIKNNDIDRLQILADSITRLRIAGILSDSQCNSARNKLMKQIAKAVSKSMQEDDARKERGE
jgi:hypothetical protein